MTSRHVGINQSPSVSIRSNAVYILSQLMKVYFKILMSHNSITHAIIKNLSQNINNIKFPQARIAVYNVKIRLKMYLTNNFIKLLLLKIKRHQALYKLPILFDSYSQ